VFLVHLRSELTIAAGSVSPAATEIPGATTSSPLTLAGTLPSPSRCSVRPVKAVATSLLLFLALCASTYLCAQSLTLGAIRGTVLDPSGAAIPNASVTLKNNDTGQSVTATTNSTGGYNFGFLNPGHYTVTANAPNY